MADNRTQPPRFTQTEAAEIIREASTITLSSKDGERALTREDLSAMARELGVSESALEHALATRTRRQLQRRRLRGARIGLLAHGAVYGIVISGLTVIDAMTGPGWWVQWPALGWGLGLSLHATGVFLAFLQVSDPTRAER
jgi:hypothetical protein